MKKALKILVGAQFFLICGAASAENLPQPERTVLNVPASEDRIKINAVLSTYTNSVSTGDRARFESQLLDVDIPFAAIGPKERSAKSADLKSVQDYKGFKKAIFENGEKFHQRFSNVKIEQVENLAQVSLDYETALQGTEYSSKGWKVLQLIKVNGQWKIASEFFTGYPAR